MIEARQKTRLRDLLNELYAFGEKIKFLRKYEVDVDGTSVAKVDVLHLNAPYFADQRKGLVPQVAEFSTLCSKHIDFDQCLSCVCDVLQAIYIFRYLYSSLPTQSFGRDFILLSI